MPGEERFPPSISQDTILTANYRKNVPGIPVSGQFVARLPPFPLPISKPIFYSGRHLRSTKNSINKTEQEQQRTHVIEQPQLSIVTYVKSTRNIFVFGMACKRCCLANVLISRNALAAIAHHELKKGSYFTG
jgi:hypothetical protein